jgi:hypothetical protein
VIEGQLGRRIDDPSLNGVKPSKEANVLSFKIVQYPDPSNGIMFGNSPMAIIFNKTQ